MPNDGGSWDESAFARPALPPRTSQMTADEIPESLGLPPGYPGFSPIVTNSLYLNNFPNNRGRGKEYCFDTFSPHSLKIIAA